MAIPANPFGALGPPGIQPMATRLTKGRIVLPKTRALHEFMFNPTEVKTSHQWKWGKHSIVGHSHNILSGGSGEDEPIEVPIFLDGDRGRMGKRRRVWSGPADASQNDVGFDISDELSFYRSLTFPDRTSPNTAGAYVTGATPATFILTLGSAFTRVNAVMADVSVHVTAFTPKLEPLRAKLELKLLVSVTSVIYASDVYAPADPDSDSDFNYAMATGEFLE